MSNITEMTPTHRGILAGWMLATRPQVTTVDLEREFGVTLQSAGSMLKKLSAVLPIYSEGANGTLNKWQAVTPEGVPHRRPQGTTSQQNAAIVGWLLARLGKLRTRDLMQRVGLPYYTAYDMLVAAEDVLPLDKVQPGGCCGGYYEWRVA